MDVASGRVVGWRRRARFVFVRRGRLQVARRRAVLRALQALAAGQPSSAADGPRLSHRSKPVVAAAKTLTLPARGPLSCLHHHCCGHYDGCKNPFNETKQVATPLVPQQNREAGTQCGTKDAGTSTDRTHIITINLRNDTRVTQDIEHSSGDDFITTPNKRKPLKANKCSNRTVVDALLGKQKITEISISSVTSEEECESRISNVSSKTSDDRPRVKRKQKTRVIHDSTDTSADDRISTNTKTAPKVSSQEKIREYDSQARGAVCKELVILEEDVAALRAFVARTRPSALARFDADDAYKRALFYAINPLVEIERCARLERALSERREDALHRFAARLGLARCSDAGSQASARYRERSSSADTDKENQQDSRVLTRKHPERSKKAADTEGAIEPRTRHGVTERGNKVGRRTQVKTEVDETPKPARASGGRIGVTERGNKEAVEERDREPVRSNKGSGLERGNIEAVVDQTKKDSVVERSKETAEQTNKRSIEQFGNKDKTVQCSFKTKETVFKETKKQSPVEHRTKDSELRSSRENIFKEGKQQSPVNGIKKTTEQRTSKQTATQRRKETAVQNGIKMSVAAHENSDDKPKDKLAPPAPHDVSKRTSGTTTKGKEYSNLEDHAIVTWLCSGSRACLVNGNQLWRELQDAFPRLAGRARSWHSLRNRYLRYILPALGALHLPPADVSRLRAAAATGTIKTKRRAEQGEPGEPRERRNSIFREVPIRGASSRRVQQPQPSPSTDDDDDEASRATDKNSDANTVAPKDDIVTSPSARRSLRSHARDSDSKRAVLARSPRDSDSNRAVLARSPRYSDSNRAVLARSPRYSDITRRFAARRRPDTSSPETAPAPRSRKLYNPNI